MPIPVKKKEGQYLVTLGTGPCGEEGFSFIIGHRNLSLQVSAALQNGIRASMEIEGEDMSEVPCLTPDPSLPKQMLVTPMVD